MRSQLGDGTFLMCPKCGDEDPSENSEAKALAGDFVVCPKCSERYKARYDDEEEKFIVLIRDWTRNAKA